MILGELLIGTVHFFASLQDESKFVVWCCDRGLLINDLVEVLCNVDLDVKAALVPL